MQKQLIKRYMMAHYNLTLLQCMPKKYHELFDATILKEATAQMQKVRLISKREFESLCLHIKSEDL